MFKNIIIFAFFAISLFFIGTYIKKFNATSQISEHAKKEQEIQKEQESLIQIGEFSDGAKLYSAKLRKSCKMSGFSLARLKTKQQWEEIAKKGKFADTITSICPKVDFDNLWTPDIYEYLHKNAINSNS